MLDLLSFTGVCPPTIVYFQRTRFMNVRRDITIGGTGAHHEECLLIRRSPVYVGTGRSIARLVLAGLLLQPMTQLRDVATVLMISEAEAFPW